MGSHHSLLWRSFLLWNPPCSTRSPLPYWEPQLFIIHKFAISRLWWSCTPVVHSPFRLFLYKKKLWAHMYVFARVCFTCVYMCIHMHVPYVHVCRCVYMCICMWGHMCVWACAYACGCMAASVCVCVCSGFISDVVVKFPDKKQLKGEGFLSFLHMWDLYNVCSLTYCLDSFVHPCLFSVPLPTRQFF